MMFKQMNRYCATFIMAMIAVFMIQPLQADPGMFHDVLTQRYLENKNDLYWMDNDLDLANASKFNASRYKENYSGFFLVTDFNHTYEIPTVNEWVYQDLSQLELKRRIALVSIPLDSENQNRILAIWSADSDQHLKIAVEHLAMAIIHTYQDQGLFDDLRPPVWDGRNIGISTGINGEALAAIYTVVIRDHRRSWEDEKFYLSREYDAFTKRKLDSMAYALPVWITDQIDRQWAAEQIRLMILLEDSESMLDGTAYGRVDDIHYGRELGVNLEAYGFRWVANIASQEDLQEAGGSIYVEAGAIRSIFSRKIDLYGMYRRNLIRRKVQGMPLTEEERKELIQFGARYFLNKKRSVSATIDLIYSFDQAVEGIQLNNSENGIRLRAGIQYLF